MGKKILVIDDSPMARRMLMEALVKQGYDVVTADDGPQGVTKAREETPDLVITDTVMPGIDGFEVCRQIKKRKDCTPPKVMIVTGTMDAVDAGKARKAGADHYSVKTSDFTLIKEIVQKLI
jgi:DNA-binding response OmpR family regulator